MRAITGSMVGEIYSERATIVDRGFCIGGGASVVEVEGREVGGERGTTRERRGKTTGGEETVGGGGVETIKTRRQRRGGQLLIRGRR